MLNKIQELIYNVINEMDMPGSSAQALTSGSSPSNNVVTTNDVKTSMAVAGDSTPKGNGKGFKNKRRKIIRRPLNRDL
jgi:hypothetical protein